MDLKLEIQIKDLLSGWPKCPDLFLPKNFQDFFFDFDPSEANFCMKIVHEILKVSSKLSLAYYLMSEIFSGFLIDFIIFIICRLYSVPLYVHCTEVIFVTD